MFEVMKFWLDRGVAGFRLGATLRRMRAMVDRHPGDRVLIGETYVHDTADLDRWYGGAAHDELHLPMDMLIGFGAGVQFDAAYFRRYLDEVETRVHGSQPLLVFDNHDNPRTPTDTADVKDPIGITGWPAEKGRDGERTPMQWTAGPQAGFSTNPLTWLPVGSDYRTVNVQIETADPNSLHNWYKTLIALRRSNQSLHDGSLIMLGKNDADVLAFVRSNDTTHAAALVALNPRPGPALGRGAR